MTAVATPGAAAAHTPRAILLFWLPLALQWTMMALEGPFLAAVIARLGDPTFNLAAYGVAFAFAILVESPVIMLMSASTALVEDSESYRRMRAFSNVLMLFSTGLLLLVLVPAVFDAIMVTALALPLPVAELVYGSLWILLPWPAAIGYRRFLHGVMIRAGQTRRVAYGTGLRLLAMAATATILAVWTGIPGAWVGAAALSVGVCVEALATRFMAASAVRAVLSRDEAAMHAPPVGSVAGGAQAHSRREAGTGGGNVVAAEQAARVSGAPEALGYRAILRFYYPLALTSLIGLTIQPLLTFFMGRAPSPVVSLAVFPVVNALYFLFSALGLSFQEAAIALLGRRNEHWPEVRRFAAGLALAASGALAVIAWTPLAGVWFGTISGLTPELAAAAATPARILVLLPALSVILSLQRAVLVQARTTRPITVATAIELAAIASLFPLFGWYLGFAGVTAAVLAFFCGRSASVLFLLARTRAALRRG